MSFNPAMSSRDSAESPSLANQLHNYGDANLGPLIYKPQSKMQWCERFSNISQRLKEKEPSMTRSLRCLKIFRELRSLCATAEVQETLEAFEQEYLRIQTEVEQQRRLLQERNRQGSTSTIGDVVEHFCIQDGDDPYLSKEQQDINGVANRQSYLGRQEHHRPAASEKSSRSTSSATSTIIWKRQDESSSPSLPSRLPVKSSSRPLPSTPSSICNEPVEEATKHNLEPVNATSILPRLPDSPQRSPDPGPNENFSPIQVPTPVRENMRVEESWARHADCFTESIAGPAQGEQHNEAFRSSAHAAEATSANRKARKFSEDSSLPQVPLKVTKRPTKDGKPFISHRRTTLPIQQQTKACAIKAMRYSSANSELIAVSSRKQNYPLLAEEGDPEEQSIKFKPHDLKSRSSTPSIQAKSSINSSRQKIGTSVSGSAPLKTATERPRLYLFPKNSKVKDVEGPLKDSTELSPLSRQYKRVSANFSWGLSVKQPSQLRKSVSQATISSKINSRGKPSAYEPGNNLEYFPLTQNETQSDIRNYDNARGARITSSERKQVYITAILDSTQKTEVKPLNTTKVFVKANTRKRTGSRSDALVSAIAQTKPCQRTTSHDLTKRKTEVTEEKKEGLQRQRHGELKKSLSDSSSHLQQEAVYPKRISSLEKPVPFPNQHPKPASTVGRASKPTKETVVVQNYATKAMLTHAKTENTRIQTRANYSFKKQPQVQPPLTTDSRARKIEQSKCSSNVQTTFKGKEKHQKNTVPSSGQTICQPKSARSTDSTHTRTPSTTSIRMVEKKFTPSLNEQALDQEKSTGLGERKHNIASNEEPQNIQKDQEIPNDVQDVFCAKAEHPRESHLDNSVVNYCPNHSYQPQPSSCDTRTKLSAVDNQIGPLTEIPGLGVSKNPRLTTGRNWLGLRKSPIALAKESLVTSNSQKENEPPHSLLSPNPKSALTRIASTPSSKSKPKSTTMGNLSTWLRGTNSPRHDHGFSITSRTDKKSSYSKKSRSIPSVAEPQRTPAPLYTISKEEVQSLVSSLSAQLPPNTDGFTTLGGKYYTTSIPSLDESPSRDEKERNPIAVCMDLITSASNEQCLETREKLLVMARILVDAVSKSRDAECASEEAKLASLRAEQAAMEVRTRLAEVVEVIRSWRAQG